jgi:hypothetical protein
MAARIPMIAMTTSNSTNVNAREALIEHALRLMGMAYHGVLIVAKHFFRILPAGRNDKAYCPNGTERGPLSPHGPFCQDFEDI